MIFRAAWSCFLVRKEPLVVEIKEKKPQASPGLQPLRDLIRQGRAG